VCAEWWQASRANEGTIVATIEHSQLRHNMIEQARAFGRKYGEAKA